MLKYVLGGVALAATGYGLKKYFDCEKSIFDIYPFSEDKNNSFDDAKNEILSELKEPIKEFEKSLSNLYSGVLRELRTAVNEIDNLPKDDFCVDFESTEKKYNFTSIGNEIFQSFHKYIETLKEVEKYICKQLNILDEIIINSNDFSIYSKENKELIQELIYLYKTVDNINQLEMTLDGITISREIKRAFGKLESIIA
ncbi:hypothetical protein [Arcobacter ellisii]|uniref:Uncharacterized protein n=1 Tax=Arcobacter ellisii TaxID=913109 RepID=A0A347UA44_9BACT|nr:hypothetical protein [Arcobacter ellisii]AXX95722.1 hypothetical protein AELL_2080 [Arcobacter ellisii]RXI31405.1 hypothetical protein CP962_04635 [Arcobacter ellisii]